ncbi:MAG TPA: ABC transporter ATP-binding protein [Acidimicrobiales bacterium]|nr:ABC transporter ATP-binding protein [Acidimicrobiales bacterium]
MITLHDVTVRYGPQSVVGPVSEVVSAGEWVGVIGPNGAGKTTILRAVARLVAFGGEVLLGDTASSALSPRSLARLVAYVPQQPEMPPDMSVGHYVLLGRTPHIGYFGVETAPDRRVCGDLLERLELAALARRPLASLSGGELQRLVLARALAQEAPVLLLDEPTSALDLGRRVDALELVDALRRERELTVVSAMHDLTLAGQFADRLLLMSGGTVVAGGKPDEVLTEGALSAYFGTGVRVMRSDDGDMVVVPRRAR